VPNTSQPSLSGFNPGGYRLLLPFILGPLFVLIWLTSVVWGWLFPSEPLLDRLPEDELPAWVTGAIPPTDAAVSFDAPEDWELDEGGAGVSAPGGPFEQAWSYGDFDVVRVRVTLVDGLAEASWWPHDSRRHAGEWESVDFYELDAYTKPANDTTDSGPGRQLLVRVGSWEVWVDDISAEPDFLLAVAERVGFDPPQGGEGEDPDERALTVDTDLVEVCDGRSFPDGAAYEGPAPHPTQVLLSSGGYPPSDDLYTSPVWEDQWPGAWPAAWAPGAADPGDIQLVACVLRSERQMEVTDVDCLYEGGGQGYSLQLAVMIDPVVVYEVRTGAVVGETTVQGQGVVCPPETVVELGEQYVNSVPTLADYLAAVEPYVFA
jgi:hypothetical protein